MRVFARRYYWEALHEFAAPPWEIGRPQKEFVRLAQEGQIRGEVLEIGCGKGALALHLAELGLHVVGIDLSVQAIERAQRSATERNLRAEFLVANALKLKQIGRQFDTAVDAALFHILTPTERIEFAAGLHDVLKPHGRYYSLGLEVPDNRTFPLTGHPSLSRQSIVDTFGQGWRLEYVRDAVMEHTDRREAPALLFAVTKVDEP